MAQSICIPKNPDAFLKVLPYFDAALLVKYAKAKLLVEIGLIDEICPSSSIYAAINQWQGKKWC